jgi:protein arginine N-methyltransferase 1
MLKDEVRTKTYQLAIQNNKHLFENKIILDVGCGTGILSMFAVQAGAKHVYAVDCSSIIHHAKQIVCDNNMSEKITLIQGKMEDIDLHSLYGI